MDPLPSTSQGRAFDAVAIASVYERVWPTRKAQEAIWDLGERKEWTAQERQDVVEGFCSWMAAELDVHEGSCSSGSEVSQVEDADVIDGLKQLAARLRGSRRQRTVGVAGWISAFGGLLGIVPKSFANSITGGLVESRRDHRWARFIAQSDLSARERSIVFHDRTSASVATALRELVEGRKADAADALLLHNLVALWQRRRPTHEVRGNRGIERARIVTPKPIKLLSGELGSPGQVAAILAAALEAAEESRTRVWMMLAAEVALTELHMLPHRARSTDLQLVTRESNWAQKVRELVLAGSRLGPAEWSDVLEYRLARIESWRSGSTSSTAVDLQHPYVQAIERIDAARAGVRIEQQTLRSSLGVVMLRPQLLAIAPRLP